MSQLYTLFSRTKTSEITNITWVDRSPGVDETLLIENPMEYEKSNEAHMNIDFKGSVVVVEIEDPPYDRNDVVHQPVFTSSLS